MVVTLIARPKRINLRFNANGDENRSDLWIDCAPGLSTRRVLEIGNRHVFANRASRPILGKRKLCDLSVLVHRKSTLTPEQIGKLGLSDSKIGELVFVPPGEKSRFWSRQPAALQADVWVSNELFDGLVSALQHGEKATWLELEIEKEGILEYGWEPDGSRATWKLENETKLNHVDLEELAIGVGPFQGRPSRFFAQITDIIPSPLLWVTIGILAFIFWEWIWSLLIRK